MVIYTIQSRQVLDRLITNKKYTCDAEKSHYKNDFDTEYKWMAAQMDNHAVPHPDNLIYPIWGWYRINGHAPTLNDLKNFMSKDDIILKINIPENKILLSDYDAWHYVLNNMWYDNSTSEYEFDLMHTYFDTLPRFKQKKLKEESWLKIFNITKIKTDWFKNGYYVQGTFWEITDNMLIEVIET